MGARKKLRAEKIEIEEKVQSVAFAKLNDSPISPRKMRLVADLVRGVEVNKALNILQHNAKDASLLAYQSYCVQQSLTGKLKTKAKALKKK